MLFTISDRDVLIDSLPKGGRIAELGVYTGDHAELMLNTIECEEMHLVDHWSYSFEEYNPFPDVPAHFEKFESVVKGYMGDDPVATLEKSYQHTLRRFEGDSRVTIHRKLTSDAVRSFDDGYFDMIYVDASHQYEHLLRDLLEYAPKLKRGGMMLLNDFYDSPEGRDQNLGVMGAVAGFVKRSGFQYVALTASAWSDLAITNDGSSEYCQAFTANLLRNPCYMIEISDSVVPSYQHKVLNLGDGRVRSLASFA